MIFSKIFQDKEGSTMELCVLDFLPKIYSLILASPQFKEGARVEFQLNGIKQNLTLTQFLRWFVQTLKQLEGSSYLIIHLTKIIRNLELTKKDFKEIINTTLLGNLQRLTMEELPPMVYQLLLLYSKTNVVEIIQKTLIYINKYSEEQEKCTNENKIKKWGSIQGTIISHISLATKQNQQFGIGIINLFLKRQLILTRFNLALLFSVSSIRTFKTKIFNHLQSSFQNTFNSYSETAKSQWLKEFTHLLSDSHLNVKKLQTIFFRLITDIKRFDWLFLIKQIVFFAIEVMETITLQGKENIDQNLKEIFNNYEKSPKQKFLIFVGDILVKLFINHKFVRSEILTHIFDHVISKSKNSIYYILVLNGITKTSPESFEDLIESIKGNLTFLNFLDPLISQLFLESCKPLILKYPVLLDHLMIILRKALFNKDQNSRLIAVKSYIWLIGILIQNQDTSLHCKNDINGNNNAHSLSQNSNFNYPPKIDKGSQKKLKKIMKNNFEKPNNLSKKESKNLIFEIMVALKRILSQQLIIRKELYRNFIKLMENEKETSKIIYELLNHHFLKYYETNINIEPPFYLDKCIDDSIPPKFIEPFPFLFKCFQLSAYNYNQIIIKTNKNKTVINNKSCGMKLIDLKNIKEKKYLTQSNQLLLEFVKRLSQTRLSEFDLGKHSNFNIRELSGQNNYCLACLLLSTYQCAMELIIQRSDQKYIGNILLLFKNYNKLFQLISKVKKPQQKCNKRSYNKYKTKPVNINQNNSPKIDKNPNNKKENNKAITIKNGLEYHSKNKPLEEKLQLDYITIAPFDPFQISFFDLNTFILSFKMILKQIKIKNNPLLMNESLQYYILRTCEKHLLNLLNEINFEQIYNQKYKVIQYNNLVELATLLWKIYTQNIFPTKIEETLSSINSSIVNEKNKGSGIPKNIQKKSKKMKKINSGLFCLKIINQIFKFILAFYNQKLLIKCLIKMVPSINYYQNNENNSRVEIIKEINPQNTNEDIKDSLEENLNKLDLLIIDQYLEKIEKILKILIKKDLIKQIEVLSLISMIIIKLLSKQYFEKHLNWFNQLIRKIKTKKNPISKLILNLSSNFYHFLSSDVLKHLKDIPYSILKIFIFEKESLDNNLEKIKWGTKEYENFSKVKIISDSSYKILTMEFLKYLETKILHDLEFSINFIKNSRSFPNIDLTLFQRMELKIILRFFRLSKYYSIFLCCRMIDNLFDKLITNLIKFFKLLTVLTVYYQCFKLLPTEEFSSIVDMIGKIFIPSIEFCISDKESNQSYLDTTRTQLRKSSKIMPNLVFEIENFQRHLIELSKFANINYMKNFKRSVARDFRITIEKRENESEEEENIDEESDDDEDDDVEGSSDKNKSNSDTSESEYEEILTSTNSNEHKKNLTENDKKSRKNKKNIDFPNTNQLRKRENPPKNNKSNESLKKKKKKYN
ncbi:hypothetical protein M0813_07194 [Anaeramoeba flamelloides]|uniref:Uncharacterized protein n=1 Tax=Anaeramoeba flamelloides TaxID=1746091 RepID=A0ABQ8XBD1_9EUKA|nr:hypothetical protein M0813_07194 [Anaeramoeba flamelloides]